MKAQKVKELWLEAMVLLHISSNFKKVMKDSYQSRTLNNWRRKLE